MTMAAEFLPLCDVLFNVISLAGYFCDVVFDVVMSYALLERGYTATAATALTIIVSSLLISQVVSLRWYWHISDGNDGSKRRGCARYAPYVLHCLQLGVLWRYAKLFVPVDLRYVKHEVRNLCMLRLVHAFCEAAPMLLLQLYVLAAGFDGPTGKSRSSSLSAIPATAEEKGASAAFTELNVISASLSLFSVCWALASFSKNVRLQNVHRLVLTWLGVIFQFAWRLGTISARVTALTVYASLYEHWVFLVIGLHWVSMFLWLISPKNVFHGERISRPRKAYLSALIAFVYVFAYVNLQEVNHRQKMVTFYMVMMVENCLLVCVWMVGVWGWEGESEGDRPDPAHLAVVPLLVLTSFFAGIAFMLLYYRYFHVRRLGYELGGRLPPLPGGSTDSKIVRQDGNCENQTGLTDTTDGQMKSYQIANYQPHRNAIPGVFNCRFSNPVGNSAATKRKKKKPTSFVPPPAAPPAPLRAPRPAPLPFWRRPLPAPHNHSHCGGSSENEGSSIGSRVNIHQKLQEKKQKQLAELKIIEEEIKQGKLANNAMISGDEIYSSLQRQPIPRTKKHIDLEPLTWAPPSPELTSLGQSFENLNTLGQNNCSSHSPKLYDGLVNALNNNNHSGGHQNNGYENFSGFTQNPLSTSNLVGQFLGSFPSYTEIPNLIKNTTGISPINIQGNYESVNSNSGNNNNNRNMSPSSQISSGEQNNSLTRQILPRSKNVRQLVTGQHRSNVYPSERQKTDIQRLSEQARVLYGDSNGLRVMTPHQNTDNNNRIQHSFPDSSVTQRISNFSPSIGDMSRNMSYDNNKSISPRNVTNMSPKTIYTAEGSGTNSFERSDTNQANKLMNISRQLTATNSNSPNSGLYHENQSHGRQYSGVYSVSNQELNNSHGLNLAHSTVYPELRQDNIFNSKQNGDYREFRQNYDLQDRAYESEINKIDGAGNQNRNGDGSRNAYAENGNQRSVNSVYSPAVEGSIMKPGISFPYQVVSPAKSKFDRNGNAGNNLNCGLIEQARKMPRCKTTEILLAPHFLEGSSRQSCCHWGLTYRCQDNECSQQNGCCVGGNHVEVLSSGEGEPDLQGTCRPPSDIDSQISLPRSYTLPREFKYYRRNRQRRLLRPDHFVASTNSSDGDVDSGDDNESERLSNNSSKSHCQNNGEICNKQGLNVLSEISQKYHHSKSKPSISSDSHSVNQTNGVQLEPNQNKILTSLDNRGSQINCQNVSVYGISTANTEFNNPISKIDELQNAVAKSASNEMNMPGCKNDFENGNRYNQEYGIERQPFYAGVSPAHGRQLRNRMYGITKPGMVKHETKL